MRQTFATELTYRIHSMFVPLSVATNQEQITRRPNGTATSLPSSDGVMLDMGSEVAKP